MLLLFGSVLVTAAPSVRCCHWRYQAWWADVSPAAGLAAGGFGVCVCVASERFHSDTRHHRTGLTVGGVERGLRRREERRTGVD